MQAPAVCWSRHDAANSHFACLFPSSSTIISPPRCHHRHAELIHAASASSSSAPAGAAARLKGTSSCSCGSACSPSRRAAAASAPSATPPPPASAPTASSPTPCASTAPAAAVSPSAVSDRGGASLSAHSPRHIWPGTAASGKTPSSGKIPAPSCHMSSAVPMCVPPRSGRTQSAVRRDEGISWPPASGSNTVGACQSAAGKGGNACGRGRKHVRGAEQKRQ